MDWNEFDIDTRAVRAGQVRTQFGEQSEPIFPTSSFTFESAAQAAARFAEKEEGFIYSRFTNPTVSMFQDRLASLEGGEACVATASGMAAVLATCLALLQQGDHIVASRSLFGSTVNLFCNVLPRTGIEVDFVSLTDLEAWDAAIKPNTKMLFMETPSNPLTEVADIKALAELAHRRGCMLVVDNCFCTPALLRPLELGADIVVHSATKYLDGQGRCIGGAVVGDKERVDEKVFGFLRTAGPCMSPFNAWVFLKGMETLSLRMKAHCENALALAEFLDAHPKVTKVYYPGLAHHAQHELAAKQQNGLYGGILAFEVAGGREGAWKVIDSVRIASITANLGDLKTTITHPATTTHGRIKPEQREIAGITEGLMRVSVGIESIRDLKADFEQALG